MRRRSPPPWVTGSPGISLFIDGNKRTAFVAVELFLELNGFALAAEDADRVMVVLRLAEGSIGEGEFAAWIRDRIRSAV